MIQTDLDPANDINTSADLDCFDTPPLSSTEPEHLESFGVWQEDMSSTDLTFEMENDPGGSNRCDRYGHQIFF
jgi:hypothetical protein